MSSISSIVHGSVATVSSPFPQSISIVFVKITQGFIVQPVIKTYSNNMSLLPDLDDTGRVIKNTDKDDTALMGIVDRMRMVDRRKYDAIMHRVEKDGWSVQKALQEAGVMVCIRK